MDPVAQNIYGATQLVGSRLNKANDSILSQNEGVEGELKDELDLSLSDEELLKLKTKVETRYSGYAAAVELRQKANLTYYLGKQKSGTSVSTDNIPIGDNLIFEATETFIPAALAKNPEPVVFSDDTKEGDALAKDIKIMLSYHADVLSMRAQLNLMVRKWTVDILGVIKHGWDTEIKDITDDVRDVKNFIFDVDGYVDINCNFVGLVGERITCSAQELADIFPKHSAFITIEVDGNMGTNVVRTEWWSDKFTFTSFKDKILDKSKNPHYNYDKRKKVVDEYGLQTEETIEGNNHFGRPKKPYTFLSLFSFGDRPHDVTGLIEQNIPNQRRVTRRTEQIDFNLSRQNNSDAFSANNFTQETATQAKNALAMGNPVLVPQGGPIGEAIVRLQAQGLDSSFFNDLESQKTALRMSFGTEGITASPPDRNELATGLMINKENDSSRVSGGMGDALERVAKAIFNQHTQFYKVYYTEPHAASIMGQLRAVEYSELSSSKMNKKVVVSVSPNSMKPHDEATEMNQALQLWRDKAIDPKTLLTRVNFPDPQGTAAQAVLWLTNPQAYMEMNFPEINQKMKEIQQGQPNPEQQQAQAEMEMKQQVSQIDLESKKQQMVLDREKAQQDMAIKQQEAQLKIQLSQQEGENKLKLAEIQGQQKIQQGEESHKSKLEQAKKQEDSKPKEKTINNKKE